MMPGSADNLYCIASKIRFLIARLYGLGSKDFRELLTMTRGELDEVEVVKAMKKLHFDFKKGDIV